MDVAVLCALRVTEHGADRTPRGQRSRDLLAALLLRRGQAVEAPVLLDLVWGSGSGLLPTVVHTQMARLRRDIGGDRVLRSELGYRLSGVDVDVDRFTELVARARGSGQPETTVTLLREALGTWRGDRPYADVTEELVAAEVTGILALRTAARELLAEHLLQRGDRAAAEEAAGLGELLVGQDPMRERGHELAILAAARAGRRAEALERYDLLRRTLRDELGIDPGPDAQELQLQLLRDELAPVPVSHPRPARTSAPSPTSRLHGREHDLAQVQTLLGDRRLVSIVGLGGVGKSRLLFELASVLGADVGAYVDLASLPVPPGQELVEAVSGALGVTVQAADPLGSLAAQLGDRELIVLADEAEHCVTEMAQLAQALLARCPGLRLVVTSRRPLGVEGEAVHVLGPLATPPESADPATIAASPAVTLLRDRIADRSPAMVQGEKSLQRLAEFSRRVDGVPLALQLLAAQAPGRSLDELAALLDAPLRLASDDAGLSPRHRTMGDTVGWSLDRLSDDEQRALRRLSVFAGRFEPPAARAVVGTDVDADAALHALVRDALVHVERADSGLSFRLLRPVRDLARERLVAAGELDAAVRRHRRWHADRWRGAPRSDALLYDVRDHYADYVVALAGAHEARDREQVVDLSATLGFLWIFADMLSPGLRWCTRGIDSGLLSRLERARLLRTRGVLQSNHDAEEGRRDLTEAIPVLAEHGDLVALSGAHYALALERSHSGDDAAALEHARLGVEAARLAHEDERLADALAVLAIVASELEPSEAEAAAQEAWTLVSRSGSVLALSGVAINLVWAQMAMGRPEVALDLVARARSRLPEGEVPDFLRFVGGWALLLTGDAGAAVAEFDSVIASNQDALGGRWLATCYLGAAIGLAALGHPNAPELLTGAEANWARVGTAPAPWQEPLLNTAREQAAVIGLPPWGAENTPGSTLAALVRGAAADRGTTI